MKYQVSGVVKGKRICFYVPSESWAMKMYEKSQFTSVYLVVDGNKKLLNRKERV